MRPILYFVFLECFTKTCDRVLWWHCTVFLLKLTLFTEIFNALFLIQCSLTIRLITFLLSHSSSSYSLFYFILFLSSRKIYCKVIPIDVVTFIKSYDTLISIFNIYLLQEISDFMYSHQFVRC